MKKGFELSVSFLVMLIITIVVFGLGIRFAYNLFSKSHETIEAFDEQTQRQIENSLYAGNIVAIPSNQKEISIGKTEAFGLGILNQLGEKKYFKVFIGFSTAVDEHGDKFEDYILDEVNVEDWTFKESRAYELDDNEHEIIPLSFTVPLGTKKGTYVFNVEVYYSNNENVGRNNLYDAVHQIRIIVK